MNNVVKSRVAVISGFLFTVLLIASCIVITSVYAGDAIPMIGDSRLFMSSEERNLAREARRKLVEPVKPVADISVVTIDSDGKPLKDPVIRSSRVEYRYNGIVFTAGKKYIWVDGKRYISGEDNAIELHSTDTDGAAVFQGSGGSYRVSPGGSFTMNVQHSGSDQ
ncbi:hypothetical protein AB833_25685 [Chromatiales bacterium (ex Bugula neritina AB1)]|nr:hypothetical protein AB833_25685 [Chromatiales bacterium (ex Bugula neritina AB1)]